MGAGRGGLVPGEQAGEGRLAHGELDDPAPAGASGRCTVRASTAAGAGRSGIVELAMGEAALTGLLAWLEAAPPGSHLGVAL